MQWLRNFKISQKILVLIAIAVLFISIVGYAGYYFTSKASESIEILYKHRMIQAQSILNFNINFGFVKADMYKLMLTNDNQKENDLLESIKIKRAENNLFA